MNANPSAGGASVWSLLIPASLLSQSTGFASPWPSISVLNSVSSGSCQLSNGRPGIVRGPCVSFGRTNFPLSEGGSTYLQKEAASTGLPWNFRVHILLVL